MSKSNNENVSEVIVLPEILNDDVKQLIIERTKSNTPLGTGIVCVYCGAFEVYCDPNDTSNQDKWSWMIRAYKVDALSKCNNCTGWF